MTTNTYRLTANRLIAIILIALQTAPLRSYGATPISVDTTGAGQKPIINSSANQIPVIQIVPPNTAGVSHNRFTQYNVGLEGQVLNNSGLASTSILAGPVAGNPMLGNSSARMILNEVTTANQSALNGTIEIAGKRADLVIANPNGITVNGAGFINTARAVLSTGKPQLTAGVVGDTLSVQQGQIVIQDKGLDARGADQLLLLSRSLQVNASLQANQLNIVTGANLINTNTGAITSQTGTGANPTVAVDVGNLGSMYANSIYLIGTDAGVGVNSKGKFEALTGDIQLSSAGDLTVIDGQLKAAWDIRANARRDMTLQGTDVQAGGDIELVTGRHLNITATRIDKSTTTVAPIAGGTYTTTDATTEHIGSVLQASGDISLIANNVPNPAATLTATSYATQRSQQETNIATLQNQVAALKPARDQALAQPITTISAAAIAAYDAAVIKLQTAQSTLQQFIDTYGGGKITISASGMVSDANILTSGADISMNSLANSKLVRNVTYTQSKSCNWLGISCKTNTTTSVAQNLEETLQGGEMSAIGDISAIASGNRDSAGNSYSETGDLVLLGAKAKSKVGHIQLTAANDVEVESTQTRHSQLTNTQSNSQSSFLFIPITNSTDLALDAGIQYRAEGSTITGSSIQISSGRDSLVRGSVLSADRDIQIVSGRDLAVVEARDLVNSQTIRESRKSGLFNNGDGLFGITLGSTGTTQASSSTIDSARESQIGSIAGGISMVSNGNLLIQGSDIIAGADIDLLGNNVSVMAARNVHNQEDSYSVRTSGLTLALKGGALGHLESAWQASQRSRRTEDQRLKTAYDLKAGYDLYRATQETPELASLNKGFSDLLSGNGTGAAQATGVNLELSLGASSSTSTAIQKRTDWRPTKLASNGDTTIMARTPAAGQVGVGKLDIMGSHLDANNLTLSAGTAFSARNSVQTSISRESSSNTAASVGVGLGSQGLYATASGQIGNARGQAFKEDNGESRLSANNALTLLSGGNADLKGTIVTANRIDADILGNLTIASLQDSERYQYKSSNAGGSISVPLPPGTSAPSGSISAGTQTISSQYQSVIEQSGLFAGDKGFSVKVGGLTNLVGAAIVSSGPAASNQLITRDLTYSDLANSEQSSTAGYTFGLGTGAGSNFITPVPNVGTQSRSSTTQALVSPGTIQFTDISSRRTALVSQRDTFQQQVTTLDAQLKTLGYSAVQAAVVQAKADVDYYAYMAWYVDSRAATARYNQLLGQARIRLAQSQATLAGLQPIQDQLVAAQAGLSTTSAELVKLDGTLVTLTSRTLATANPALNNTFDVAKTRNAIEAMNVFSETAMRAVGDSFKAPIDAAQRQIAAATAALDTAQQGGNAAAIASAQATLDTANAALVTVRQQQVLAHGAIGGLTAALGGTDPLSGMVGGAAGKATALIAADILAKAIDPKSPLYQQLIALTASAAGYITGSGTGGFIASQGDRFNRQLHESEQLRIKKLANGDTQQEARLTAAACAMVKCYAEYPIDSEAYLVLKKLSDIGLTLQAEINVLSKQTNGGERLFGYSAVAELFDPVKRANNTWQLGTRALGAVQTAGGVAGMVASVMAVPTCITVVGCIVASAAYGTSVDSLYAGSKQILYGTPQSTQTSLALQALGLNPEAATIVEMALGMGSFASISNGLGKAGAQALAKNTGITSITQDFKTLGIPATPGVLATPDAIALRKAVKAGNPTQDMEFINRKVIEYIESGANIPTALTASDATVLLKFVPKGWGVSESTGYFVSLSEGRKLATMDPAKVADLLAVLPATRDAMIANGFDLYKITPKAGQNPTVFLSKTAPTNSGATGGITQTIAPNRLQWNEPIPLNTNNP